MSELGKYLKEQRVKKGLSQKAVADAFKFNAQFVCLWENGKSKVPVKILPKLCNVLGVSRETVIRYLVYDYKEEIRLQLK
jgi:transcriptional regulator with XRE-family HTH domain